MGSRQKKYLVVLAGPTGIGKTKTSVQLAKYFQTEIVSFDSRQLYKEMKIGTDFPSDKELKQVPHHMLGTKSIHEYYNASMFEQEVIHLLDKFYESKNLIVMTGGTGLYLDAILQGIDDLPDVDVKIRSQLRKSYEEHGLSYIQNMLKSLDPDYYENVDLNNPNRILKALEITKMTNKPYSYHLTKPRKKRMFNPVLVGLNKDRKELYENINQRVENMIKQGLVNEAKALYPHRSLNALNTVGYKELFQYIDGKISLEEAVDLIKRNTRKYARRQLTWFRRYNEMKWFDPNNFKAVIDYVKKATGNNDISSD